MVQLKILLDTRRMKADGTYPIVIRVTNIKEVKYIPYGISVPKEKWDESSRSVRKFYPNASVINNTLVQRFMEVQREVYILEDQKAFTFKSLVKALSTEKEIMVVPTFFNFTSRIIDEQLTLLKTGNAMVYRTAVKRLSKFHGSSELTEKSA